MSKEAPQSLLRPLAVVPRQACLSLFSRLVVVRRFDQLGAQDWGGGRMLGIDAVVIEQAIGQRSGIDVWGGSDVGS